VFSRQLLDLENNEYEDFCRRYMPLLAPQQRETLQAERRKAKCRLYQRNLAARKRDKKKASSGSTSKQRSTRKRSKSVSKSSALPEYRINRSLCHDTSCAIVGDHDPSVCGPAADVAADNPTSSILEVKIDELTLDATTMPEAASTGSAGAHLHELEVVPHATTPPLLVLPDVEMAAIMDTHDDATALNDSTTAAWLASSDFDLEACMLLDEQYLDWSTSAAGPVDASMQGTVDESALETSGCTKWDPSTLAELCSRG
jgi:hypothetical protein